MDPTKPVDSPNLKFSIAPKDVTFVAPERKDITSHVSRQNAKVPVGAVHNLLAAVLTQLLSITGADPMWIDVIHPNENRAANKTDLKTFTEKVVKAQDMPTATLFKQACKDSDTLAVEFPPKVAENRSRLKRDVNAEMLRPAIDLIKYAAKQNKGQNIAMGQAQINAQNKEKLGETPKTTSSHQMDSPVVLKVTIPAIALMLSGIQDPKGGHLYKDIIELGVG